MVTLNYAQMRMATNKNKSGRGPKDIRKFKPKVWNNKDNKRCPMEAYKVFRQNRPKEMDRPDAPFFLALNHQRSPSNPGNCWFKNCPLGKNLLYKLVPNIKAKCQALSDGLKLTIHSVRKHLCCEWHSVCMCELLTYIF